MNTKATQQQQNQDEEPQWTTKKINQFIIVNHLLGKGAFAKVYRGFFEQDENKHVAVKTLQIKAMKDFANVFDFIKREIFNLQMLDSPFIVKLYDIARTQNNLYMFLEYCQDGDLKQYLKKKQDRRLTENEALIFLIQIINAFKQLRKNNIIHRDIKPANILLNDGIAKVTDFGFSRVIDDDYPILMSRLGPPLYMAPQISEGIPFSYKSDVWSVGIVLYEMLYGFTPWSATNQTQLLINIKTIALKFPEHPKRQKQLKILIRNMLQYEEYDRISWEEVFQFEFIQILEQQNIYKPIQNFEVSLNLNELYIKRNLVAGYFSLNTDQNIMKNQNNINENQIVNQFPEKNKEALNQIIQQQKHNDSIRKTILKINDYFLYERNISFFCNFVIQKCVLLFNEGKFPVQPDLYFRLCFCISKYQNIQLVNINSFLKSTKSDTFDQQMWIIYLKSQEYSKTLGVIKADIAFSTNIFDELYKKTSELINIEIQQQNQQLDKIQNLKDFLTILNKNFEMDDNFKNNMKKTLQEVKKELKNIISFSEQETLILASLIFICANPYQKFCDIKFDFNKFYEDIENTKIEDLKKQILLQLE
ncbi:protein kinase domain protein [Ichthyophthirius multifiliis]|uniref:Protein kinase domain protein n=1 Tax=Ichthyophthirius multifiliis TaxID=5932 RepID=G0R2P6_ICHMU|nr:protein kinase domain protein [Ichthyophthirius multifiliis]EGR28262.1 protein kinase domain protein [Ichthyophthirius multifiliis]|eukprot:XP_004027607.1 protein kinase domain protein [Ichthyophthirius multifiliis]